MAGEQSFLNKKLKRHSVRVTFVNQLGQGTHELAQTDSGSNLSLSTGPVPR